jgi:hypothetical protein
VCPQGHSGTLAQATGLAPGPSEEAADVDSLVLMRRLAILAVVAALTGCGSTGATTRAANCLRSLGWKVEHVSPKELRATRFTSTLTYRAPAEPVIETPATQTYDPKLAACLRGLGSPRHS